MSWGAVIIGTGALAGGAAAGYGASKMNKKRPGAVEFQPYGGYRPPHIDYDKDGKKIENLRPVQQQITDILMRRSKDYSDVGFDPKRRELMMKQYDLSNEKNLARQKDDIVNALSGMGLSRNLGARDELYNRAMEDAQRSRDLYQTEVDIQDMTRANEERDVNTARLQNLNTFNFGQENKVADFDLDVYNAEQANRYRSYDTEAQRYNQYQEPVSRAFAGAIEGGKAGASIASALPTVSPSAAPNWSPSDALAGTKLRKYDTDANDPYLSNKYKYLLGGK